MIIKKYIKVINILEEKCKYIEIVVINGGESNKLIDKFTSDIMEEKKYLNGVVLKLHGEIIYIK